MREKSRAEMTRRREEPGWRKALGGGGEPAASALSSGRARSHAHTEGEHAHEGPSASSGMYANECVFLHASTSHMCMVFVLYLYILYYTFSDVKDGSVLSARIKSYVSDVSVGKKSRNLFDYRRNP